MKKNIISLFLVVILTTIIISFGFDKEVQAKNGFNQKPTSADGFKAGKNGQKVRVGNDYGWKDSKGRVWIPDGKMHGGKGWTRQYPDGSHDHVYPGGNVRSHNISGSAGHKKSKINWITVSTLGLLGIVTVLSPIPGDELIVAGALLGL